MAGHSKWKNIQARKSVQDAKKGKNMFALGMLCFLYSFDLQAAREQIALTFGKKSQAIIDANVTTFISAMVMFFLGSGPVKGFAVTLTIGIATSVFTAIFLTRLMIVFWLEWRKPKQLVL